MNLNAQIRVINATFSVEHMRHQWVYSCSSGLKHKVKIKYVHREKIIPFLKTLFELHFFPLEFSKTFSFIQISWYYDQKIIQKRTTNCFSLIFLNTCFSMAFIEFQS